MFVTSLLQESSLLTLSVCDKTIFHTRDFRKSRIFALNNADQRELKF